MFHQSGCHVVIVSESVRKTREAEDEQSAPDPLPVETHLLRNFIEALLTKKEAWSSLQPDERHKQRFKQTRHKKVQDPSV